MLDECDDSMDLIVLPEYSDVLADVKGKDAFYNASEQYSNILLNRACATAKRCNAIIFVNSAQIFRDGNRRNIDQRLSYRIQCHEGFFT